MFLEILMLLLLPGVVALVTLLRAQYIEQVRFNRLIKEVVSRDVPDLYLWVVNCDARVTDIEGYLEKTGYTVSVRSNIIRALKGNDPTGS